MTRPEACSFENLTQHSLPKQRETPFRSNWLNNGSAVWRQFVASASPNTISARRYVSLSVFESTSKEFN